MISYHCTSGNALLVSIANDVPTYQFTSGFCCLMLEHKRGDRYIQEALIECSQVDTAPYISVLRDNCGDLTCGWLKVKPFPLYEHRTRSKAVERKNKDVETERSRGKKSVWTKGKKLASLELRPLKKITPAQKLVKDAGLEEDRIMKRTRRLGGGHVCPSVERGEWKPLASHASRYVLDEKTLKVQKVDVDSDRRREKGTELMARNSMSHTVGLLVQRLLPSEKILGYTL